MDYNTFKPVIVTLSNGLRVANFSSNHEFKFVDGTILPAVSDELCSLLSMDSIELPYYVENFDPTRILVNHIKLSFVASHEVTAAINMWYSKLWTMEDKVDIVIVPLPVITMLRNSMNWTDEMIYKSPFRTIRVADRLTKLICIDKFCI